MSLWWLCEEARLFVLKYIKNKQEDKILKFKKFLKKGQIAVYNAVNCIS